ncbi:MAG: hypothetical protein ACE5G0_06805 [Rhodothermales bacterium]
MAHDTFPHPTPAARLACFGLLMLLITLPASAQLDMDKLAGMKARSIGPAGMSGRVTAIDVTLRDPDTIYLGTASGGLWKSTDAGTTWEPIFDDQPATSIGALAVDRRNPDVIWVGTGEGNPRNSQTSGNGLYKSIDGGRSWTHIGFDDSRNIHRLIIHPDRSDIVYVGIQGSAWGEHDGRGVFKTADGGTTWTQVLAGDGRTGIADLVMDPQNPEKLLAAMWEFRRWPWFFKSGGPGSGIFVTFDGGTTWTKRTDKDGLPKGDLGRIGLGISRSKPNVVYALVEAEKNALYRSDDGGFKWQKINDENNVNPRPFYYADIYVDPQNENRLYSLHSSLTMSEDGGKTFNTISRGIHSDHHALWIHPDNPEFMIDGNDGGAAISRNGGQTWRFIENLPLAQFYHIRVDMDTPYNLYGGMQDNGSWRGPSQVWSSGGIRNAQWTEVGGGDGFDVLPDPLDSRYGYAMSQGGSLSRYDLGTGERKGIRPHGPDSIRLRFNWNAAIAADPHDRKTIYYGSQFVHKTSDHGTSWEIISPDLTTNDPEKQKQLDSGGLTYDVTNAENFTTIVAIEPSPVQEGVLWVGTDDGHVQLTTDGGQSWTNVFGNIQEVPEGTWVQQIQASTFNAGEAFVVFDDHRRNNWTPYVFKTTDYGQSWTSLVSENDVQGYALSLAPDPIEPNLLFLGTEFGLYFSLDAGTRWTQWTHGYPTASTMDLVIHPRDHDLVIGTFGRAAYILDDIRPLRALAREGADVLDRPVYVFDAPEAIQYISAQAMGTRFSGSSMFSGENRPQGAMITYVINAPAGRGTRRRRERGEMTEEQRQERIAQIRARFGARADAMITRMMGDGDQVPLEIVDENGEVIRTLQGPAKPGINRVSWDMRRQGSGNQGGPSGGGRGGRFRRSGPLVMPGTYTVRIRAGRQADSTTVTVLPDPRKPVSREAMLAKAAFVERASKDMEIARQATQRLNTARETVDMVTERLRGQRGEAARDLRQQAGEMQTAIDDLVKLFSGDRNVQGIRRDPNVINSGFFSFGRQSNWDAPTQSEQVYLSQAEARLEAGLSKVNHFFEDVFPAFQQAVEAADLPLFETYERLTLPTESLRDRRN